MWKHVLIGHSLDHRRYNLFRVKWFKAGDRVTISPRSQPGFQHHLGVRVQKDDQEASLRTSGCLGRSHNFSCNSTSLLNQPLHQTRGSCILFSHSLWSQQQEGEDLGANVNICEAGNELGSGPSLKLTFCFSLFAGLVLTQISSPIN